MQPQPLIKFDLPNNTESNAVPEELASFFDSEGSQATATAFVNQFFPLYDSNRQGLLPAYAHDGCFSVRRRHQSALRLVFCFFLRTLGIGAILLGCPLCPQCS